MSIRAFIKLSLDFHKADLSQMDSPFLVRRMPDIATRGYAALGLKDKLHVHGIIDRQNYLYSGRRRLNADEMEATLAFQEKAYGFLIECQKNWAIHHYNAQKIDDPLAYEKVQKMGCIPVYIALDLGNVLQSKPLAPHSPPFSPVPG